MALHTLEICSGVGMLGEGLRAGLDYLGVQTRTICHIEREAYAAAVLAARIEEGSLDAAPVWSDLCTFDAGAWRGAVDCIVAGFPCQDISLAGRRAGLDGARSGLFFNILDIADACGAQFLFLENVAGIASATATVVDQAEGTLDERAAARVVGELADRGWDAEWITLSASDVGASHGRARWFCWAWRREVGHARFNAGSAQHGQQSNRTSGGLGESGQAGGLGFMDNTGRMQRRAGHEQDRPGVAEAGRDEAHYGLANGSSNVAHAERAKRRQECARSTGAIQGHDGRRREADGGFGIADAVLGHADDERAHRCGCGAEQDGVCESANAGRLLADTQCINCKRRGEPGNVACTGSAAEGEARQWQWGGSAADSCSGAVADTSSKGQQGGELGRACTGNWGGGANTWTN